MPGILLTNDDGVDSPALVPLARALQSLGEDVRVVVPSLERSWISKAISRWGVKAERVVRDGVEICVIDGFPADCANLGIHTLFGEAPGTLVAGVNIGLNVGLGFFLSSGTVGAAIEGRLAGIPALAFSVGLPGRDREWKSDLESAGRDGVWDRAAALSADVVSTIRTTGWIDGADLVNVNFPLGAGVDTQRVVAPIAPISYGPLYRHRVDDVCEWAYSGALIEDGATAGTDLEILRDGCVSITPVRLAHAIDVDDSIRARLERRS
jgi:5'-nucleotidase